MACNTLLLSDDGEFSTKPELEIFADDVQCGHGATVTEIDRNHLFYLMARGIDEKTARGLLVKAFVAEVIEELDDEAVVEALEAMLDDWFATHWVMPTIERAVEQRSTRIRCATMSRRSAATFPILSREVYGKPLVYLDNGASAQKPQAVHRRDEARLLERIRQRPSRPAFPLERRDRCLREGARDACAAS